MTRNSRLVIPVQAVITLEITAGLWEFLGKFVSKRNATVTDAFQ